MKYIDVRNSTLPELVAAYAVADAEIKAYATLGLDVPEAVSALAKDIQYEVRAKTRAEKEAKLAKARARRVAMMSTDEKRALVDAEIAKLEAELA